MPKKIVKLRNTVFWDPKEGDKVYLDDVQIAVMQFPFDTRLVFVRFAAGPAMDFSIYDMDRFVASYLKLRQLTPPAGLGRSKKPDPCDFSVPLIRKK